MTDIVERLRVAAVETFALPIATVMDSAADEIERLRMTVRAFELTGERRRVSGGSSPVDVKSAFISEKTLTAVLEALRSNWFIATDEDEDNNDEVIAATKMLEAEIATQNNAVPAAGSDGSHSDGNRARDSDPPTGDTLGQAELEELVDSLQERIGRLLITDVGIDVMLAAASHFETQHDCQMKAWSYVLRRIAHKHRDAKLAACLESEAMQLTHGDDITVRLTRWCEQPADRSATQVLMDEAAAEIERLRLTDAEREAIYRAEARLRTAYVPDDETADTLRSLLERLR
jgi:hypothetical protein